jgi:hypothetical protein
MRIFEKKKRKGRPGWNAWPAGCRVLCLSASDNSKGADVDLDGTRAALDPVIWAFDGCEPPALKIHQVGRVIRHRHFEFKLGARFQDYRENTH